VENHCRVAAHRGTDKTWQPEEKGFEWDCEELKLVLGFITFVDNIYLK
jgi:hypothetical protein